MTSAEFKQKFLPHHKVLYRVAYHMTGNAPDAEDLLQELYLKLWQHRDAWAVPEEEALPYLITMIRRMRIDRLRLKRLAVADIQPEAVPHAAADNIETEILMRDELQHIARLIPNLPQREQRLVEMHIFNDMSYKEIESSTGLSPSNVRVTMMRARQKIKEQLKAITRYDRFQHKQS